MRRKDIIRRKIKKLGFVIPEFSGYQKDFEITGVVPENIRDLPLKLQKMKKG